MSRTSFLSVLACAALASPALAQNYTFQIDTNATSFVWDGTTSLGDIVEMPANFSMTGTVVMQMDGGGNPVGSGRFVNGGDALITPDIGGEIPNPIPFLPPLATLQLQNVHVGLNSPPFTVSNAGGFTATITMNMLAGTLMVDPISGSPTTTDLTGQSSAPTPANGTLTWDGTKYTMSVPVNSVFPFADAASGVTGSFTLLGTLVATHEPLAPVGYCASLPNSSGQTATLLHSGQPSLGAGALTLHSNQLPANTFGLFFYGPTQVDLPFGDGRRCVAGSLVRFAPVNTGALGSVSQLIDNAGLPSPVQAGDLRNFQFWFRDVPAGNTGFNTSDALGVAYTP